MSARETENVLADRLNDNGGTSVQLCVCVCHNVGAGKLSHRPTDKIVLCRLFAAAASTSSSSGTCHQAGAAATTPPHLICTFNFDCTLAAAAVCSASLSARRHLFVSAGLFLYLASPPPAPPLDLPDRFCVWASSLSAFCHCSPSALNLPLREKREKEKWSVPTADCPFLFRVV